MVASETLLIDGMTPSKSSLGFITSQEPIALGWGWWGYQSASIVNCGVSYGSTQSWLSLKEKNNVCWEWMIKDRSDFDLLLEENLSPKSYCINSFQPCSSNIANWSWWATDGTIRLQSVPFDFSEEEDLSTSAKRMSFICVQNTNKSGCTMMVEQFLT